MLRGQHPIEFRRLVGAFNALAIPLLGSLDGRLVPFQIVHPKLTLFVPVALAADPPDQLPEVGQIFNH